MKRIEFGKDKRASFFLLPAIGIVRTEDYSEGIYYYKLSIGWYKFYVSVVIFTKLME